MGKKGCNFKVGDIVYFTDRLRDRSIRVLKGKIIESYNTGMLYIAPTKGGKICVDVDTSVYKTKREAVQEQKLLNQVDKLGKKLAKFWKNKERN